MKKRPHISSEKVKHTYPILDMKNLLTIKFAGRMCRAEYWPRIILLSLLFTVFLFLEMAWDENYSQFAKMCILMQLYLGLVMTGMTTRRFHDVGVSGWRQLLIVLPPLAVLKWMQTLEEMRVWYAGLVFCCLLAVACAFVLLLLNSKPGGNKYGPNPKEGAGDRTNTDSVKSYLLAAEQGNADAQYNLGKCYLEGIGVEKDEAQAKRWLQKAADNGNTNAKALLQEPEQE